MAHRNILIYNPETFLLSFLAAFAAFLSLGDRAGFFFTSRLFLCSLLIMLSW